MFSVHNSVFPNCPNTVSSISQCTYLVPSPLPDLITIVSSLPIFTIVSLYHPTSSLSLSIPLLSLALFSLSSWTHCEAMEVASNSRVRITSLNRIR
ncbi:hypothetical protein MRB53_035021 [Persea americana]|uniref:Uncharacterized protein n=1 Tax=Persea americana TaxID=3435 RepID=A0ACC2K3J5_PERAE|nr:hypothetical protein MRB53_035021 [Persea americana]